MPKINFTFSDIPLLPGDIQGYYDKMRNAILTKYDESNVYTQLDFFGMMPSDVQKEKEELLHELSIESSFSILSYIESMFRTDFIIRRNWRKRKDPLANIFKAEFSMNKRYYQYPLVGGIFAAWLKVNSNDDGIKNLFNQLTQAFAYRNWIAHGRYWKFRDNPDKYDFNSMMALYCVVDASLSLQKRPLELEGLQIV